MASLLGARYTWPRHSPLYSRARKTMATARKSFILNSLSQYYTVFIGLIRLTILSRILSAEEFGVFSIAMSFVTFARVFRNFGIWDYIISAETLTKDDLRKGFTIVLTISFLFAALFLFLTNFIGDLY